MKEEKKYQVVNLMYWDDEEQDDNVECTSLSDDFTKLKCTEETEFYPDQNMYIGKPRYFFMTLKQILKYAWEKDNIDLFCKNNSECYGVTFRIWNWDREIGKGNPTIEYTPKNKQIK